MATSVSRETCFLLPTRSAVLMKFLRNCKTTILIQFREIAWSCQCGEAEGEVAQQASLEREWWVLNYLTSSRVGSPYHPLGGPKATDRSTDTQRERARLGPIPNYLSQVTCSPPPHQIYADHLSNPWPHYLTTPSEAIDKRYSKTLTVDI